MPIEMEGFLSRPPSYLVGSLEALFGLILFPSLFHGCVHLVRRSVSLRSQCPPGDLLDICNKLVSAVFAVLSVSVGLTVIRGCGENVMTETHPLVRHYMCFGLSYFLYDIYSMYLVFMASRNTDLTGGTQASEEERFFSRLAPCLPGYLSSFLRTLCKDTLPQWIQFCRARKIMVVHHILIPFFGFPIFMSYRQSLGDCLIALGFCMEASTPFVSARAILHHLGQKSSLLYLINGLLMNIVFFICRILVFPYMYTLYARQCGLTLYQLLLSGEVPPFCNSSMLLLFLPQIYWFSLMLRGSLKVINRALLNRQSNSEDKVKAS